MHFISPLFSLFKMTSLKFCFINRDWPIDLHWAYMAVTELIQKIISSEELQSDRIVSVTTATDSSGP